MWARNPKARDQDGSSLAPAPHSSRTHHSGSPQAWATKLIPARPLAPGSTPNPQPHHWGAAWASEPRCYNRQYLMAYIFNHIKLIDMLFEYVCGIIICMYAETLGCMCAETLGSMRILLHVWGNGWGQVYGFWVHVYGTLGCLPDCLCLPDSR